MCKYAPLKAGRQSVLSVTGLLAAGESDGLAFSYIQGWHMFLFLNQELKCCDARIPQIPWVSAPMKWA